MNADAVGDDRTGRRAVDLDVDGRRPAVAWVAALPRAYRLTPAERLVLLALACDSWDGRSAAPGYDNLAAWTGLWRSSVVGVVRSLTEDRPFRPALISRLNSSQGRNRTAFLLIQPVGHSDRSADPTGSESNRSGNRSGNRSATPDGKPVGEPVGETGHSLSLDSPPPPAPEEEDEPQQEPPAEGEHEQLAREVRPRVPGATTADALETVRRIAGDPDTGSVAGRTRSQHGERVLRDVIRERLAAGKRETADVLRELRRGPECEHGDPGGASLHPTAGTPLCPSCRNGVTNAVTRRPRPDVEHNLDPIAAGLASIGRTA